MLHSISTYSVYLLYWYKSTKTDASAALVPVAELLGVRCGRASTTVQMLTSTKYKNTNTEAEAGAQLGDESERPAAVLNYLLYWFSSTNIEAEAGAQPGNASERPAAGARAGAAGEGGRQGGVQHSRIRRICAAGAAAARRIGAEGNKYSVDLLC